MNVSSVQCGEKPVSNEDICRGKQQWWANQRFWVWFCTFPLGFACPPMGSLQGLLLSPTHQTFKLGWLNYCLWTCLWLLGETPGKTDARTDNLCFTMIGITVMFLWWVHVTNQSHYFKNLFSHTKGENTHSKSNRCVDMAWNTHEVTHAHVMLNNASVWLRILSSFNHFFD